MTTLLDILRYEYQNTLWTMRGEDDYAGLEWLDPSPKPTEAEMRAKAASAETKKAEHDSRMNAEQQAKSLPDPLIRSLEIICYTFEEIITALPASVRDQVDTSRIARLRNRLAAIRNDPGD